MTLLLWNWPENKPILECWGSKYGVQYYTIKWKNIFAARGSKKPVFGGSVCSDCKKPIHKHDAEVCIDCGGLNRRA